MPRPAMIALTRLLTISDARPLVVLLRVHQLVQREQAHHHLLRQREAGGVVQGHVAAVGDDAVDELDLARLQRQRAVALVEQLETGLGAWRSSRRGDCSRGRRFTEAPAGATEILAIGVHADGVARKFVAATGNPGLKMNKHRGSAGRDQAVDFQDAAELSDRFRLTTPRRWDCRDRQEERLYLGVLELLDSPRCTETGPPDGPDIDYLEVVVLESISR